jgi:GT2 family glycosyltransferase
MGGRVLPLYPPEVPEWIKKNRYYLRGPIVSYDHGEEIVDFKSGTVAPFIGANVVYRKSIFTKVGGFNIELGPGNGTFGDDIEMFERASQTGESIFYNGRALVLHKVDPQRMTLRYIALWNFRNGKYKAKREKESKKPLKGIKRTPFYLMRRVLLGILLLILSLLWPPKFLKNWCSLAFDCGMIAGHRDKRL